MRNRKDSHSVIRQNDKTVKKSQKHDANLQKNSTLYFQVGLIVCLLMAYGLIEMKFETKITEPPVYTTNVEDDLYVFNDIVKPEEVKKKEVKKKSVAVIQNPIISENDPTIEETPDLLEPKQPESNFNPDILGVLPEEPVDDPDVSFVKVEQVPLYPGCEKKKTRDAQSKCMSDKITKLIQRKFDVDLANELGLTGRQKIQVQFKIDKTGKITSIKTRAPHPKLEKEAQRVVDLIPDMTPGKQRDKPVAVRYNLPINFQVNN